MSNPPERKYGIQFVLSANNIKIQMQTENVSPLESVALLEMAKCQILDSLGKDKKLLFDVRKRKENGDEI